MDTLENTTLADANRGSVDDARLRSTLAANRSPHRLTPAAAYDPVLSRFQPLPVILSMDTFERSQGGWMDLMNNFVLDGFKCRPSIVTKHKWGPVMLSNANFGYAGTHGAMTGGYSLKLATKPYANRYEEPPHEGGMSHAIKRLTAFRPRGLMQIEFWYAYTPEQDRCGLGEPDIRAFGTFFDIQDDEYRYFAGARYLNSVNGELKKRWQYCSAADVTDREWAYDTDGDWCKRGIDPTWFGKRRSDGSTDGFKWLPGGEQQLCYNESADKINWSYFRLTIDTAKREYVELQSGNRIFDMRGLKPTLVKRYAGVDGLVNPCLWIEADNNRRVFLFVDSIVISCE